jgi:L-lactate dehydrogenase complex protein LldE
MNVHIFVPCFIDQLYPETAFNMVKVLEKAGCNVYYNKDQTCCGQPAFNAGFWNDSKAVCSKFLKDFEDTDFIVAPSASCVGFIRNYYSLLFEGSPAKSDIKKVSDKAYEFSEFMVKVLKIENVGARLEGKATYHDSCAGLRECKIKEEPRRLLGNVEGLEIVEMEDVETCCGFGGSFAVKFEPISIAMADQKITHALATGAKYIISTDQSCLMHLDGYIRNKGYSLQALHIADVLANGW